MLFKRVTNAVKKHLSLKRSTASVHRQEEILHLKRRLEEDFSIQFVNLANRTSSAETQSLMEISKTIAQNKELLNTLSPETELVVQHHLLAKHAGITPKILEENHQFIVTMAHILGGPYPFLRKFISSSTT